MSEPIDISPSQRKELLELLKRHLPNVEVWVFGSRVKWTARSNSDLDLVAFAKPEDEGRVARLKEAMEESSLPFRVDFLVWDNLPENFKKNIQERYVVLVEAVELGRGWVMASEHPLVRLGDYVDACLGKMLDAQKNRGELQPYLGNSNVRWGSFDLADLSVMRFEDHEEERYGISDGDLIVCEGGEPGRCAIWRGDAPMKIQKALHRVRTKAGLDNYFLYYWFLRAGSTGELEPFFTGTTIKHLTGKALAELRIPLPPIESQREAAKVLRSLDDKIDLNRRINQTLEAMAQAIFKSWFVDFDPVKAKIAAKQEGRDPLRAAMSAISGKSDAELDVLPPEQYDQLAATAALFPEEMEESEFGEIPKGWKIGPLSSVADVNWGDTKTTKSSYVDSGYIAYSAAGPDGYLPTFDFDRTGIVVSAIGANSGATWLARGKWSCIKNTIKLWSIDGGISTEYLYHATHGKHLWPLRGSAQPFISQTDARLIRVLIPKNGLALGFGEKVEAFYATAAHLNGENNSLTTLRDTLLPKLLSGELSVADTTRKATI